MVALLGVVVLVVGVVAVVVVRGGDDAPGDHPQTRPDGPLVPDSGVLLGGYVSAGAWESDEEAVADLAAREEDLDRSLAIAHHFYAWQDRFPSALERADADAGRLPLVTWEPFDADLDDIADGDWDRVLRARARDVAAFDSPVLLRFAHEMNGDWYSWSGAQQGGDEAAAQYVRAWQHVHDVFAQEGADQVVWVWSPNNESVPDEDWNHWSRYYPGDAYVDWVGVDGYTGRGDDPDHASFEEMFGEFYDDYATRKPIVVAEVGAGDGGTDRGDVAKAEWVRSVGEAVTRLPAVVAVVWFDEDKEERWQMDSGPATLQAFRDLAADPWWAAAPGPP